MVGGVLALLAVAAVWFANTRTLSPALHRAHRLWVFYAGVGLIGGSAVALAVMTRTIQRFGHWISDQNKREGDQTAYSMTEAEIADALDDRRRAQLYYFVVTAQLFGVWVVATSTGGYIESPVGIVFTSSVLFGQIRANRRMDIYILLATALVGTIASDVIVHHGLLKDLFAPTREVELAPASWYWTIAGTVFVSTWINLTTPTWIPDPPKPPLPASPSEPPSPPPPPEPPLPASASEPPTPSRRSRRMWVLLAVAAAAIAVVVVAYLADSDGDSDLVTTTTTSTTTTAISTTTTTTVPPVPPGRTVTVGDDDALEGGDANDRGVVHFIITVSAAGPPVSMRCETFSDTAAADIDYAGENRELVIKEGTTETDFPVFLRGDHDELGPEMDETFTLRCSDIQGAVFADAEGNGIIRADD
jgi:hypothetical protein